MQSITISEAKQKLSELIDAALDGEEIIITKDNGLLVKLTPVVSVKQNRKPGTAEGLVTIADDFDEPLEDFKDYM
ncbi:MAG: type II toxin-antitoxin system Phd/YefM family antitoxin [Xenococcaceae cyanobacterium MO_207.B15]|nr:type II toxin-antitoxin system Phd/YefM family antitoxin [Xenococcaceae cyanobacterium MO_207.B15]MDJ0745295.1 type II toxin-antitoxin system Phd/YefM family antitoxin [Xenococcaceae cyanobacterium MO_167.B27]